MNKITILSLISLLFLSGFALCQEDEFKGNQRAFYECSEPIPIDTEVIDLRKGELYFQFNTEQKPRNLKSMNFVWLRDNPKGYFTAYLVNTSKSLFSAEMQDGSLMMIQEALNEEGEWMPIEYWVHSGCGNSYFNFQMEPEQCVMVPIRKYTGNFNTQIRLKLKSRRGIIYSEPFKGSIDKSQFGEMTFTVHGILYHGPADYLEDGK